MATILFIAGRPACPDVQTLANKACWNRVAGFIVVVTTTACAMIPELQIGVFECDSRESR